MCKENEISNKLGSEKEIESLTEAALDMVSDMLHLDTKGEEYVACWDDVLSRLKEDEFFQGLVRRICVGEISDADTLLGIIKDPKRKFKYINTVKGSMQNETK